MPPFRFRFPSLELRTHHGEVLAGSRLSCVETCAQFAFHRSKFSLSLPVIARYLAPLLPAYICSSKRLWFVVPPLPPHLPPTSGACLLCLVSCFVHGLFLSFVRLSSLFARAWYPGSGAAILQRPPRAMLSVVQCRCGIPSVDLLGAPLCCPLLLLLLLLLLLAPNAAISAPSFTMYLPGWRRHTTQGPTN